MNNQLKIENFLKKEFNSNLKDICIIQSEDGSFELFNEYVIRKQTNGLYNVSPLYIISSHQFTSLKNAFTWCIFHKYKRFKDTKRIEELDLLLSSVNVTLFQQKKLLLKSKDLENKLIYNAKIHEEKIKKNIMLKELTNYINISKHLQTRKFLDKLPK